MGGPSHHALHIGQGPQWPFLDPRALQWHRGSLMEGCNDSPGGLRAGPSWASSHDWWCRMESDGWPRPEAGEATENQRSPGAATWFSWKLVFRGKEMQSEGVLEGGSRRNTLENEAGLKQ